VSSDSDDQGKCPTKLNDTDNGSLTIATRPLAETRSDLGIFVTRDWPPAVSLFKRYVPTPVIRASWANLSEPAPLRHPSFSRSLALWGIWEECCASCSRDRPQRPCVLWYQSMGGRCRGDLLFLSSSFAGGPRPDPVGAQRRTGRSSEVLRNERVCRCDARLLRTQEDPRRRAETWGWVF
jgi:hypothetical protein